MSVYKVAVSEKFVSMTSRSREMDETWECEKVTSSTIYKTKENFVRIEQRRVVCKYAETAQSETQATYVWQNWNEV